MIARIFNLVPETVYLIGDESVVVAENLQLDVLEISPSVVYDVFGEEVGSQSNAQSNPLSPLGNVFGYKTASPSGAGSSQRRPAAVGLRNPLRPTFTKPKSTCTNSGAGIGCLAALPSFPPLPPVTSKHVQHLHSPLLDLNKLGKLLRLFPQPQKK